MPHGTYARKFPGGMPGARQQPPTGCARNNGKIRQPESPEFSGPTKSRFARCHPHIGRRSASYIATLLNVPAWPVGVDIEMKISTNRYTNGGIAACRVLGS